MPKTTEISSDPASREKILDAATRLFAAEGYGSASISRVAREAEVSKALIFWHFESKENLFREALERSLAPYIIDVQEELSGLAALARIDRLVEMFAEFVETNRESIRFILGVILRESESPTAPVSQVGALFRVYGDLIAQALEEGKASGEIRADVDSALEATGLQAALTGLLLRMFLGEPTIDRAVVAHLQQSLVGRVRSPES